jgi:hypothetical protein
MNPTMAAIMGVFQHKGIHGLALSGRRRMNMNGEV